MPREPFARRHHLILERIRPSWERIFADRLDSVLTSQDATVAFLADENPVYRDGALSILAHYWPPDQTLESRFRAILSEDSDARVRASAISCLISLHQGDGNREICKLLASVFANRLEVQLVRKMAYCGILQIIGRAFTPEISMYLKSGDVEVLSELDWKMIQSVMS